MKQASGLAADALMQRIAVWRIAPGQWLLITVAAVAAITAFLPGLRFMLQNWEQVDEYSYGYFIPLIVAFLVWQKSDRLRELDLRGQWSGLWLIAVAIVLGTIGEASAVRLFSQYGFLVAVFGLSVCCIGWRGTRVIAVPLTMLFFMIPLPQFLLRELSEELQLISSQLGVSLIRALGISVFLEGNVIDLGSYKLQVVEACSGLRYLFPLMVLGALAAYFFKGKLWTKAVIVLSTVPLTIVINSLRIAIIGWTVEHWGSAMAEGLLHDFEGWFMFMVCVALLVAEMAALARWGARSPMPLRAALGMDYPEAADPAAATRYRVMPRPMVAAAGALAIVGLLTWWLPTREQIRPERTPFAVFPMTLPGGWVGRSDRLDRDVVASLALDDYLLADYALPGQPPVNLYSAYYASQSGGASTHSPRTCMPGGGWKITELDATPVTYGTPTATRSGQASLEVNRAIIQKGEQRQLVYYWFRQRGRELTNEFAVKWYILRDGVTRDRSDGAMVRLVTQIVPTEQVGDADRRLASFLALLEPRLAHHVPD